MNGATLDHSQARPDTEGYGLRARVDWENALRLRELRLSLYTDLSYIHSRQDGYVEQGGGLPAEFEARPKAALSYVWARRARIRWATADLT